MDPDLVPLRVVAGELSIAAVKLRMMSLRGEFPPLLKVTTKHYLVRRSEFETWKAGRWTTEISVRAAMVVDAARGEKVTNRRRRKKAHA